MQTPQRKIHSLMIFVLIFDASEAFNFAVLKEPFFFSRIRSLTSLRLKDISAASNAAIAEESDTEQSQHPYFPSANPHRPKLALVPRSGAAARHNSVRTCGGRGGGRGGRIGCRARQAIFECRGRRAARPSLRPAGRRRPTAPPQRSAGPGQPVLPDEASLSPPALLDRAAVLRAGSAPR